MISVTKLLCGADAPGDGLRYDAADEAEVAQIRERRQAHPVVVWNVTRRCNLRCEHCYAGADEVAAPGELSTAEGRQLLADLAAADVPVVLFSGGEPLVRGDLTELVAHAADLGLRPVLSTNGTLLTERRAAELRDAGLAYAGVSVDGRRETNDAFRGAEGAFDAAIEGIEACQAAGLRTGLRYTLTERTIEDVEAVMDLLVDLGVDRFCFYHLEYGGRGARAADVDPARTRAVVERICDLTREYHARGEAIETLLVGNYADAGLLVEYAREHLGEGRARAVYEYLRRNGGDPTGERVADIDYQGSVHVSQFCQDWSLGNVRDRPFGEIWADEAIPLLGRLRERERHLQDRCVDCAYRAVCRGGSPLRSLVVQGDPFAEDPACHLTDAEVAGEPPAVPEPGDTPAD